MTLTPKSVAGNAALMAASVMGILGIYLLKGRQRVKINSCRHLRLEKLCHYGVPLSWKTVPAHTKVSFNLTTTDHSPGYVLVDSIQTR
jgi:hypothetical protein